MTRFSSSTVFLGLSLLALGIAPAQAQVQAPQSAAQESVWGQQQTIDPISGGSGGFMELMRRLNRGTGDFQQLQRQQSEGMVSAADAFRMRQQQLLKGGAPVVPGAIVPGAAATPGAVTGAVVAPVVPVLAPAATVVPSAPAAVAR
jgi:hypothetical protein